ncbi:MAG TPA: VWA domain-containing protein [Candidatus Saccharimonadia bacterium]|nr:VWA domain-containing protein [Candidatus Saccharimonadia bacterium]
MLIRFFFALRSAGLKASITELLALLGALEAGFASASLEEFYALARMALVKDESRYDTYDRAFTAYFAGVDALAPELLADVPQAWLSKQAELLLSDDEKARIAALGGWDALMRTLAERLKEQRERHQGGSRMIGTAGTSPFGAYGYNPEGVRIGGVGRQGRAVKIWERREFRNLDEREALSPRNLSLALRRLRRFAREGAAEELDLDVTIRDTARNAGMLDLRFRPERHNAVKLLLFLDIGGSMDTHVRECEALFNAARGEFKHLEHWYFHNCIYERVWRDNARRWSEPTPTHDILHKYAGDYRVVFVGDASMSPHEIAVRGGSIEHWNEESGETWMRRVLAAYPKAVWLNPVDEDAWRYTPSTGMLHALMAGRMFPLTLDGLTRAMDRLRR